MLVYAGAPKAIARVPWQGADWASASSSVQLWKGSKKLPACLGIGWKVDFLCELPPRTLAGTSVVSRSRVFLWRDGRPFMTIVLSGGVAVARQSMAFLPENGLLAVLAVPINRASRGDSAPASVVLYRGKKEVGKKLKAGGFSFGTVGLWAESPQNLEPGDGKKFGGAGLQLSTVSWKRIQPRSMIATSPSTLAVATGNTVRLVGSL